MAHLTDKRLVSGYEYRAKSANLWLILDDSPRESNGLITGWNLIGNMEIALPASALVTLLDLGIAEMDAPILWENGKASRDDVPRGIIR